MDSTAPHGAHSIEPKTDSEPVSTGVMTVCLVSVGSIGSILGCSYRSADFIPSGLFRFPCQCLTLTSVLKVASLQSAPLTFYTTCVIL